MPEEILYDSRRLRVREHSCDPAGELPERTFDGPTLAFVRTGVGVLDLDGERTVIDPNQIVCLRAGERLRMKHSYCRGSACAVTLELPLPDAAHLPSMAVPFAKASAPRVVPRDVETGVCLHRLLADVRHHRGNGAESAESTAALEQILRSLAHGVGSDGGSLEDGARRERIGRARVFLNAQLSEPMRLEQIADAVGYSKYHFSRLFKEESGLSPWEYLTRLRLNQALEELHDEELEVSEIAIRLGFSSHSHFTSTFRQRTGMTPTVYRATIS